VAELIEIALHHRAMPAPVAQLPRKLSSRLLTGKLPTAAVRKPVVLQRRASAMPIINVVAENKGWLFEQWKQALAGASQPGYRVAASNKPMPQAEAWIFLRATEAARSPDPMRSVVHLHDLSDPDAYRPGGPRADVARCGGILLTHPAQEILLRDAGITLAMRRWAMQPVGWGEAQAPLSSSGDDVPTLAWFGRPATHNGRDVSGLADFVKAVRKVSVPMRVVLIGERLEATATALKRAGIDCKVLGTAHCPPSRVAEWIGRFDALAVTSAADCGPWPLFDAVRAGVPVVALRVGWADALLADGRCGHLVADATEMTAAIEAVMAQRGAWRERRIAMPPQCSEFSMQAWLKTNLQLAADLVPQQRMAVA
jgi:glycosyltransferase involved in cell wall biosynthesis